MISNFVMELSQSARVLLRSRWQSAVIVVIIALAVGSLTAVSSVVNAVLIKSFGPFPTDQWIYLWEHQRGSDDGQEISVSVPNFLDWKRESSSVFANIVFWLPWSYTASGEDQNNPQQIRAAVITPEVFAGTGVVPAAGRLLAPDDSTNNDHVVVLSYDFWRRNFGGDMSLVGKRINLNLVPHTVVGIAPPGFNFPPETHTDAWTPLPASVLAGGSRSARGFRVAALLRPGITIKSAQSTMTLISQRLANEYPEDRNFDSLAVPMREAIVGDIKTPLIALSGALAFALLLASINIGYLRSVQLQSRRKEMMVRLALGASRIRLLLQLLIETGLLFTVGGILGLAVSPVAICVLNSLVPATEIPWLHPSNDFPTFLVMFGASLFVGLASELMPAVAATRPQPARFLGVGGRVTNTSTLSKLPRNVAQVAQIALALVPLCAACLLIRSFEHLQDVAPGFAARNRLTLMFSVPKTKYPAAKEIAALARLIEQETSKVPGVRRSAVVQALPFANGTRWLQAVTRTDPKAISDFGRLPLVSYTVVTAGYFETMDIPLRAGRTLADGDDVHAQPVVVINEQLARNEFGGENPLGKPIWVGHAESLPGSRSRIVVGVVSDSKMYALDSAPSPAAWVPIAQQDSSESVFRNLYLVAQTEMAPPSAFGAIRERIHNIDPDLALSDIATMNDRVSESLWRQRFSAIVVGAFSVAALSIAILGVFGMSSYLVTCRTVEIGVRIALGATRSNVMKMILVQNVALALLGVSLGLLGSIAVTRVLSMFLFGISANDPSTMIGVALLLIAAVSAASYFPARRAAAVDPVIALRME